MKKMLALLLSVVMLFGMVMPASATFCKKDEAVLRIIVPENWEMDIGDSRTVDVHVKRLREKLEGASDKWELRTVWGVGYKFETKE